VENDLLCFEREAWSRGKVHVCGIDEVGRGPLAGPVVACAVVLPRDFQHSTLTDSKKLTALQREKIYAELTANPSVLWSLSSIESDEIDQINILQASWKASFFARAALSPVPDWTLVDGLKVPLLGENQTSIVKGDALSFSIAAASVLAKVTRDRVMEEMDRKFPGYGFASHKGYSTESHLEALMRLGPCPIHRRSFEPVRVAATRQIRSIARVTAKTAARNQPIPKQQFLIF
jgi:ribonuclease HII